MEGFAPGNKLETIYNWLENGITLHIEIIKR